MCLNTASLHTDEFHPALSVTSMAVWRVPGLHLRVMEEVSLLVKWIIALQLPRWGKKLFVGTGSLELESDVAE